jgi:DNA-binding NarL/FixJ family response regulator
MTSDRPTERGAGEARPLGNGRLQNGSIDHDEAEWSAAGLTGSPVPPPAERAAKLPQPRRATRRIALIAQDTLTRDMLEQWLQKLGKNVRIERQSPDTLFADAQAADRYDIIVVEYDWKDGTGEISLDLLRNLVRIKPSMPVVVVSDSQKPEAILQALEQGVRGYIPTSLEPLVATAALHLVLSGGVFAPVMPFLPDLPASEDGGPRNRKDEIPDVLSSLPSGTDGQAAESVMLNAAVERLGFTVREAEILALLQKGKPNRQIASELGISENTVMVHIRHLMRKLGATNRTQAVFQALRLLSGKPLP